MARWWLEDFFSCELCENYVHSLLSELRRSLSLKRLSGASTAPLYSSFFMMLLLFYLLLVGKLVSWFVVEGEGRERVREAHV